MKCTTVFSALSFVALVNSLPAHVAKRGTGTYRHMVKRTNTNVTDTDVLQFALTLEHLENTFYTGGLQKYTQEDFAKAGYEPWVRNRIEEISQHEATHVQFLEGLIGPQAVKACNYTFPDTNVSTFVAVSDSLETVGTAAYNGAAHLLTNQDYLTAAASILATEARQSAWLNSDVLHVNPWSTAFETPLDMNQVFTIASGFIVSCPSSNAPLPVKAFPPLNLTTAPVPGQDVTVSFTPSSNTSSTYFAAFLSGLVNSIQFVPVQGMTVKVPQNLIGVVYVIIVTDKVVNDSVTVAGPAMVNFYFDSNGKVEAPPS